MRWFDLDLPDAIALRRRFFDDEARRTMVAAMRHLPRESWFRWKCDDPREIESWGANLRLAASKTFLDADRDLLDRVPLLLRLAARYAPVLLRGQASSYRLNLAEVEGGTRAETDGGGVEETTS